MDFQDELRKAAPQIDNSPLERARVNAIKSHKEIKEQILKLAQSGKYKTVYNDRMITFNYVIPFPQYSEKEEYYITDYNNSGIFFKKKKKMLFVTQTRSNKQEYAYYLSELGDLCRKDGIQFMPVIVNMQTGKKDYYYGDTAENPYDNQNILQLCLECEVRF